MNQIAIEATRAIARERQIIALTLPVGRSGGWFRGSCVLSRGGTTMRNFEVGTAATGVRLAIGASTTIRLVTAAASSRHGFLIGGNLLMGTGDREVVSL